MHFRNHTQNGMLPAISHPTSTVKIHHTYINRHIWTICLNKQAWKSAWNSLCIYRFQSDKSLKSVILPIPKNDHLTKMWPKRQCALYTFTHTHPVQCAQSNLHHHLFWNHWMKSFIHFGKRFLIYAFMTSHRIFSSFQSHVFQNGFVLFFSSIENCTHLFICVVR